MSNGAKLLFSDLSNQSLFKPGSKMFRFYELHLRLLAGDLIAGRWL